ncbi:PQQ-binding-like beta-propeller repeat protein [Streptomyces sp. NPDC060085]|uniref:outer membrane protein assembly factor BamB family protein n=1 Tax=Streptomyces sp. NPDC060085 TaxID=3347054 RepID=UPI003667921A
MRSLTQGRHLFIPVGLALSLVSACSDGGNGSSDFPSTPSSDSRRTTDVAKAYDPPLKFQQQPAYDIAGGAGEGDWSIKLRGTVAYALSTGEVRAVSVLNGKRLWNVKPQGQPTRDTRYSIDGDSSPHFVEVQGQKAVLAAFSITEPGTGTTPDRPLIELTAIAVDSGKRLWTTAIERPTGKEEGEPFIAGATATTAVLTFGSDDDAVSVGVSLLTRKATWTRKGFFASFVDGNTVVGRGGADGLFGGSITVEGRDLADGTKAWTYKHRIAQAKLSPVGNGLFTAVVEAPFEAEKGLAELLSTSTGKTPSGLQRSRALAHVTSLSCWPGEGSVICEADKGLEKRVVALNRANWTELWSIAEGDQNRLMPKIYTVFHDAVYGVTENGSVILDVRTGKDRATGTETPNAVNEYAGLFPSSGIGPFQTRRAVG